MPTIKFTPQDYDVAMRAAMQFIEGTTHGTIMRYEGLVHAIMDALEKNYEGKADDAEGDK